MFNDSVTHLIVKADEENRTQRTLKFLYAVACRKWVVSMDWVQQCINQGQFVEEEPFEVFDMEGEDGPRRARICDPQTKLFQAFEFCCVEPFSEVTTAQLCDLLKLCGALVVHGPSKMTKCRRYSIVIVEDFDDEDFALKCQAILWQDQHGVLTVSRDWILDCLASHTILPIRKQLIGNQTDSMLRVMGFDELLLDALNISEPVHALSSLSIEEKEAEKPSSEVTPAVSDDQHDTTQEDSMNVSEPAISDPGWID